MKNPQVTQKLVEGQIVHIPGKKKVIFSFMW